MELKTRLGQYKALAISEGISYLLLFAVTMPLKYMYAIEMPNKIVGMIHGVLFIMYCLWTVIYGRNKNWSFVKIGLALLASLFPFATFIVDAKYLKKEGE
tara:strand:+ start:153 stop:452 length:300 start_codon:yes stop_codon:yes gene_type:complete